SDRFLEGAEPRCAPKGSKLTVVKEDTNTLVVRFYEVPKEADYGKDQHAVVRWLGSVGTPADADEMLEALKACPKSDSDPKKAVRVNTFTQYSISRKDLGDVDNRRTGI